jgi:hypothetical protein
MKGDELLGDIRIIDSTEDTDKNDDGTGKEFNFDKSIKNPFAGMMKNGYSVTIHYGPRDKRKTLTYDEIIEDEARRIKHLLYEKTKNIPHGQELSDRLEEIFEAVKNS